MVKHYDFEQLKDFVLAYRLSNPDFDCIGSKFTQSIYRALCEIYDLVSTEQNFKEKWTKRLNENYHSWLSFDTELNKLVYDTGLRDEQWSNALIDDTFLLFDLGEIEHFLEIKTTKEFQDAYNVVQTYYKLQGYFTGIFSRGIENISYAEWERVSTNKYAVKVLKAYKEQPKFEVGELASLRVNRECTKTKNVTNAKFNSWNINCNISKVLILSNTEPIVNARKGAKRYKVAPIGGNGQPFWIEEAFMKKLRKKVNKKK
jgi:hypothetical protein